MTVQTQHPSPGVERANAEVSNIAELVRLAARRGPEHPAVVDALSGAEFSWASLDAAVSEQARRLREEEGVSAGDRVLLRLPTGPAFCVALFGALRAGAVAVPVSPSATSEERERILADCAPAALLVDEPRPEASPAGPRELAPVRLDEFGTWALPTAETAEEASTTGSDLAVLAYTSGTSGPSRAAMLSHGALLANVRQCGRLRPMPVNSADRVLLALPLFHIYGLGPGLLQVASVGATAVLLPRFDAEAALDAISELRVTSLVGVPPMYFAWLQLPAERLRSGMATVRLLTSGAAPLGVEAATEVRAATGLDVFEGYGLTETGPVLTTTLASGRAKPGSVGAPLPGVELRLVDVDGQPLDSPADAARRDRGPGRITGLVSARGPNLFSGYWPDGLHGPDRDGWFRTGDVGHFDEDGDLCLVDRVNDLVIVNGFNVYPHEVEDVLLRLDGVSEVAVAGVPDGSLGEALKAVIVVRPGAELSETDVREHCARRLVPFKVPALVEFAEQLPQSTTGKVARRDVRDFREGGGHRGERGADNAGDPG